MHDDHKYIKGLVENNSMLIQEIYKKFVPKVVYFIKNNSGNEEAAQDVIQEVLITLYHQGKVKGLVLTCPFDAYFFLLCKRKWINELKKPTHKEVTIKDDSVYKDESIHEAATETEIFEEKQSLFEEMFQKLGAKCQEVLRLSFAIKSMEEVAAKLNVTYAYVRKKKSLCTGQLTEMIQQSDKYKSLKS
jgi:RNA polymerase sigma factor (sigma-70 family)